MLDRLIARPALPPDAQAMSKAFIANVFSYMFAALAVSAVTAYVFASDESLMGYLATSTGMTGFGYVVMFAPIGIVLIMQSGYARMSSPTLLLLFLAFSVLIGMSLSFIFFGSPPTL